MWSEGTTGAGPGGDLLEGGSWMKISPLAHFLDFLFRSCLPSPAKIG